MLVGSHQRAAPDTLSADVEGLNRDTFGIPSQNWPLVDALGVELRQGDPLVWLAEVPTVETPTLEKAPLGGTTINVAAAPGTLSDHGLYTNLALQAGSNPTVVAVVTRIMSASLAAAVAAELAATGTAVASVGEALAAVAAWPGQRLVLGPSAFGAGVNELVAVADRGEGAISVLVEPYVADNLVIARVSVAVGVLGLETLSGNRPSHLGVDKPPTPVSPSRRQPARSPPGRRRCRTRPATRGRITSKSTKRRGAVITNCDSSGGRTGSSPTAGLHRGNPTEPAVRRTATDRVAGLRLPSRTPNR
jgi:hypothetical protein